MTDIRHSVWLSLATLPATKSLCRLIEAFDFNTTAIYQADKETLLEKGASESLAERLSDKNLDEALKIIDFCHQCEVFLLPYDSPNYPKRLLRIPDFPILLYGRGQLPIIDQEVTIATVGTRRYTDYGKQNAYVISRDMARAGAVVVSGMAGGIDSFCHRGALDALGYTIAVLGCGIDVVYPKYNADLMEEIAQFGTVLTEYPPHTEPHGYNFPKRNRIISGLSLGTLVIEADERSGAMITARLALAQGRDLFSLPGNIGESTSLGTNQLIKDGARMVTDALDVLREYENIFPDKIHTERLIFKSLSNREEAPKKKYVVAEPIAPLKKGSEKPKTGIYVLPDTPSEEPEEGPKPRPSYIRTLEKRKFPDLEDGTPDKNQKPPKNTPAPIPEGLSDTEKSVLTFLSTMQGMTTDEIARSGIPVSAALIALTTLEIKGLVKSLPGGLFIRTS